MADIERRPVSSETVEGEVCWHNCGGVMALGKDELGCEFWHCSNYPATCDFAVYTFEQSMAHTRAYAAANPEWRAEFVRKRGREPGEMPSRASTPETPEAEP